MSEQQSSSLYMSELTLTLDTLKQVLGDYDQALAEHDGALTVEGIKTTFYVEDVRGNFKRLNDFLDLHYQDSEISDADIIKARQQAEMQIISLQGDIGILQRTSVLRN